MESVLEPRTISGSFSATQRSGGALKTSGNTEEIKKQKTIRDKIRTKKTKKKRAVICSVKKHTAIQRYIK